MLNKGRPHFGNGKTRAFCDYQFINHYCKIRSGSRLINCKLIHGLSDKNCIDSGFFAFPKNSIMETLSLLFLLLLRFVYIFGISRENLFSVRFKMGKIIF